MMEVEFVRGRIAGCHDNRRVILRDREIVSLNSYRTYTKEQCPVGGISNSGSLSFFAHH